MYISGRCNRSKKLPGLCHRAKQVVITAAPFLFLLKPTAVPRVAPVIELNHQNQTSIVETVRVEVLPAHIARQPPHLLNPIGIDLHQGALMVRHPEVCASPSAATHGIVAVIIELAQPANPKSR